jgi:hypothetical protein
VVFTFRSLGDGREFAVPGRWSAAPQPLVVVPSGGYRYDPNRAPQSIILDVSPSEVGEALGVALKYDGDDDAFAFSDEAYADPRLCNPNLVLEDDGYLVHVDASAGEITASAVFELKNTRDRRAGLKLEGPIKHS